MDANILNRKQDQNCVISGFRCKVNQKCALLGHHAASGGNSLPTFRVKNCLYSPIITQKSAVFSVKTGRINW